MDWIMVRLPCDLAADLRALGMTWYAAYAQGNTQVPEAPDGPLALHRVIAELLRRDEDHRERSRSNSKTRKGQAGKRPSAHPTDSEGKLRAPYADDVYMDRDRSDENPIG